MALDVKKFQKNVIFLQDTGVVSVRKCKEDHSKTFWDWYRYYRASPKNLLNESLYITAINW